MAKASLTEVQRSMLGWIHAASPVGLTEETLTEKADRLLGATRATAYNHVRQLISLKLAVMEGDRVVITVKGLGEL